MKKIIIIFIPALFPLFLFAQRHPANDFTATTTNNETVSLSSYLSKGPVYISFWALWCEPCKSELKILHNLHKIYSEKGLTIVTINLDTQKSLAKVKSYISAKNYKFPVLLDPNSEILEKFNGESIPFSLLLNSAGKVVKAHTGFLPGDEKIIEKEFIEILSSSDSGQKSD